MKRFTIQSVMYHLLIVLALFSSKLTFSQTTVPAGNVSGTWTLAGSPYNVQGDITIQDGTTLTIEPGVDVVFDGHYKFNVNGRILATGDESNTITFTANNTTEGWLGLRFFNTPATNDSSKFVYCLIEYGNATDDNTGTEVQDDMGGGLYIYNFSKIVVEKTEIANNKAERYGGGIYIYYSDIIFKNCDINNNSISYVSWRLGGGGICNSGGEISLTNSIVSDNYATHHGGGIYNINSNSKLSIYNSKIIRTTSFGRGSGDLAVWVAVSAAVWRGVDRYSTERTLAPRVCVTRIFGTHHTDEPREDRPSGLATGTRHRGAGSRTPGA
jgi:parallel beta helix pectate lyase-like protein